MEMNGVVHPVTQVRARAAAAAVLLSLLAVGCTRVVRPDEPAPPATAPPVDCAKTTGYDVIIVGAGMSGLTAAKELRRGNPDIKVLILEATHRIGGRAHTLKNGPPIDLGGAWLHGVATNQLTGIADTLGFKRVTTRLEVPYYTEAGQVSSEKSREFWKLNEFFEVVLGQAAQNQLSAQACHAMFPPATSPDFKEAESVNWPQRTQMKKLCEQLPKRGDDKVTDFVPSARDPDFPVLLAANIGPLDSSREPAQTSTIDGAEFEADDDVLLEKGLGTFVETYGQGAPVCLNSPVTRITYRDAGVVVEVKDGKRYEASKALVTVSTGVLKAKKIAFDPELPAEKVQAIENLPMGYMQKVIIDLKDQEGLLPEKDANSWVLYVDANRSVMAFVIRPLNKNIAIGFYGGEQARNFEEQCREAAGGQSLPPERQPCDAQAIQRAQVALGKMYQKPQAMEQAVQKADIYVTRWSLEPWTLGAYSAAAPGSYLLGKDEVSVRKLLAAPLPFRGDADDGSPHQVFFAGEACASPQYNGSMAGAYESGLRAARDILGELSLRNP